MPDNFEELREQLTIQKRMKLQLLAQQKLLRQQAEQIVLLPAR